MEQKLENIRLFNNLGAEEIARLIDKTEKRNFQAGDFIFKEGDESDSFHIIGSGRVEVFTFSKGQNIELIKLGPGTTIGEVGFIDGQERTATVKCLVPTLTLSLTRDNFSEIIKTDPKLAMKIMKEIGIILSERLRWCDKFLVSSSDIRIGRKFLEAIGSSSH
jgi:CRP-like cAMP-binding protein